MSEQSSNNEKESTHESSSWTEFLRRAAYVGVGAAFATQETATRLIREMKLPREAAGLLLQGIERNREEMLKISSRVISEYLKNLDATHILKSAMDGMNLKVTGEIQFNYDPTKKGKLNADIKASAMPGKKKRRRFGNEEDDDQ